MHIICISYAYSFQSFAVPVTGGWFDRTPPLSSSHPWNDDALALKKACMQEIGNNLSRTFPQPQPSPQMRVTRKKIYQSVFQVAV